MKYLVFLFLVALSFVSCNKESAPIEVMSFNLRLATGDDGDNVWVNRTQGVEKFLVAEKPDLLGVQEALYVQIQFLDDIMKGYKREGVGRDDGKNEGEFSAIYYNEERFEKLDGGTLWLSQTPNDVSFGWDAVCRRVVSWVKLLDKSTNKELYYLNTHYDHVGKEARRNSSKQILNLIAEFGEGANVIVSGDFNAREQDEPIQTILEGGLLLDSRKVAEVKEGPESTFHGFGRTDAGIIDYIFVTSNVEVIKHNIVYQKINSLYLSDHNPVVATIKMH